jgi:hypothetical protein
MGHAAPGPKLIGKKRGGAYKTHPLVKKNLTTYQFIGLLN